VGAGAVAVGAVAVAAAAVVVVVAGSAAARLRAGLLEPGGRPQNRPPVEVVRPEARAPAAVPPPTMGRRSVRPAGQRSPEELPAEPQVLAGLESNQAADRLLPPALAQLARVRVRRRDRPLRLAARKAEPAWRPDSGQVISRALELELAPRTYRKRAKPAPPACRSAWLAATA
jgi:hypothetical protein